MSRCCGLNLLFYDVIITKERLHAIEEFLPRAPPVADHYTECIRVFLKREILCFPLRMCNTFNLTFVENHRRFLKFQKPNIALYSHIELSTKFQLLLFLLHVKYFCSPIMRRFHIILFYTYITHNNFLYFTFQLYFKKSIIYL